MPALETEIGITFFTWLGAGIQIFNHQDILERDGFNITRLLLGSILVQGLLTGLWPLLTALNLSESYTRRRLPPLRAYWSGAFHALGTLSRVTMLGTSVVLLLSDSYTGVTQLLPLLPHTLSATGPWEANPGDALGLALVYVAAVLAALRVKQRQMDPETVFISTRRGGGGGKTATVGGGGAGGGQGGHGFVARGHRVRFWWMYEVANWMRNPERGQDRYEMDWARHWVTEPVTDAGDRMETLDELDSAEVARLRVGFWFRLFVWVVTNAVVLKLFWNLL